MTAKHSPATSLPNMGGTIPLEYVARLERDRAELIEALQGIFLDGKPEKYWQAKALVEKLGAKK